MEVKDAPYAVRWLAYGVLIGVIAFLSALTFQTTLSLATAVSRAITSSPLSHSAGYWLTPAAVILGMALSGLLVYRFVGGPEDLSIDAMIRAYHRDGRVRARIPILGWVASALTIGFGGSAGSEAPMATLSGGLASLLFSQ